MATPASVTYEVTSGTEVYGGRFKEVFDSVEVFSENLSEVPHTTANQILLISLHASGGSNPNIGRQYRAMCSGAMAHSTFNVFGFSAARTIPSNITAIRPIDLYGAYPSTNRRESMWLGFKGMPDSVVRLITYRRVEAMMKWVTNPANIPNINPSKVYLTGTSMGAWGSMVFGIRHAHMFAAIYPDMPRWRYSSTQGQVAIAEYGTGLSATSAATAPFVAPEDGRMRVSELMDCTTYVANKANRVPWIGWCIGRADGFTNFNDHIDAVDALRAAKRGFAFFWHGGGHTPSINLLTASYPYGMFDLDKGYPLFTNHSADADPRVDTAGSINGNLSFRNVVESATGWSCEVTSISAAVTVDVEPNSRVYLKAVFPKTVVIPSANTWVAVSFNAEGF